MQNYETDGKKQLVSPDVLVVLKESVCATDTGTGFSSSLILISSFLHKSLKTGEQQKQRELKGGR